MSQRIRFHLQLSADDYLHFYQGSARDVLARALDGRRLRFPAAALRPFVRHNGVHGLFEIEFDADHRLVALRRLGDL
ncbi:DUF2835 domain-containing protein [Thiohalobacter sp. IOR34]|uniref:DUF2835 domain-containing protein n=1 Tax=Thiohalobacter sp. IOR34 TaxID=3057176 RepID=UPI0025B164A2|nr:DUF2835 domain-containing protein [Thiohalobacter sp. IOR34]WJW74406.1 DUF2835 domain-containing protein [Thiohalobacter sp. IOR34]